MQITVNMTFNSIFLLSDCWHESEYEENPSVQSVYVEMPQARTPKEGLLARKTQPCDICIPILTNILQLNDLPEQNLIFVEACSINRPGPKASQCQEPIKGRGGQ